MCKTFNKIDNCTHVDLLFIEFLFLKKKKTTENILIIDCESN